MAKNNLLYGNSYVTKVIKNGFWDENNNYQFNNNSSANSCWSTSCSIGWPTNYANFAYTSGTNMNATHLNGTFYNSLDSTLKNQIATTRWWLGDQGSDNSNTFSSYGVSQVYTWERSGNNRYTGNTNANIGLIYISDYMYAPLSSNCNRDYASGSYSASNSSYAGCVNNNWMWNVSSSIALTSDTYWWTINNSRYYYNYKYPSNDSYYPNYISRTYAYYNYYIRRYNNGTYNYGAVSNSNSNSSYKIRPSFYLKEQGYATKGSGTSSNPYYIAI